MISYENNKNSSQNTSVKSEDEGYKIAKLIRQGNRELERQLNIKNTGNTLGGNV